MNDLVADDDTTYAEFSAEAAEIYEAMKAVVPPAVVLDVHNKSLLVFRVLKEILASQPGDDVVDPFIVFAAFVPAFAGSGLPRKICPQMFGRNSLAA